MREAETAVQQALDRALHDSRESLLARAGRADQLDELEALRFALQMLEGLTLAVRALAIAVDDLVALNDESRRPQKGRRRSLQAGSSSTRPDYRG